MALSTEKNFTRAASSIFLSQPAFSALINSLESEVGFRLFDRDTRNVWLTPNGEMFKHIATRILNVHQASIQEVQAIANGSKGHLSIAALPSVIVNWLPAIIADFHTQFPSVQISLIDAPSDRCLFALEDGIADLALTTFRPENEKFVSEKVYTESFFLICRDDHPLAAKTSVKVEDLADHSLINFSASTSIRQHLKDKLPNSSCTQNLEVEQLTTMMGLIMAGLGVSVVPKLALYQFDVKHLVRIPFENLDAYRDIHLIKRSDKTPSVTSQNFCKILLANISHDMSISLN